MSARDLIGALAMTDARPSGRSRCTMCPSIGHIPFSGPNGTACECPRRLRAPTWVAIRQAGRSAGEKRLRLRVGNVAELWDGISRPRRVQPQPCDGGHLASILRLAFETLKALISGLVAKGSTPIRATLGTQNDVHCFTVTGSALMPIVNEEWPSNKRR
jgi:hypothetical protein